MSGVIFIDVTSQCLALAIHGKRGLSAALRHFDPAMTLKLVLDG